MNKKGLKIICAIFFIMIVTFPLFTNVVNAAINKNYSNESGVTTKTNTNDGKLDKKLGESVIAEALGSFVMSIASLVEKIVGDVFKSITGDTDFPWADRVIFNAIPMLDVNFFNPAKDSFFYAKEDGGDYQTTVIGTMVRNTYFTVLSICVAFLTIIVAIAATKMALSAIASEKAKYKEAITKWLFSIVLIFLMHNLMSFIFFVNEAIVEVASQILVQSFKESESKIAENMEKLNQELDDKTIVDNFFDDIKAAKDGDTYNEIVGDTVNLQIAGSLIRDNSDYQEILEDKIKMNNLIKAEATSVAVSVFGLPIGLVVGIISANIADEYLASSLLLADIEIIKDDASLEALENEWGKYEGLSKEEKISTYKNEYADSLSIFDTDKKIIKQINSNVSKLNILKITREYFTKDSSGNLVKKEKISGQGIDIIKNLAAFLKSRTEVYETKDGEVTGWKPDKTSLPAAILYAIFVAQSILYFFSYIKRFFYIVVLAIMAPAIVLFDFLGKAVG